MKQLIIARKDLNMSPGKLAAQVSHASMAFLMPILKSPIPVTINGQYCLNVLLDCDIYDDWINGIFTKVICRAKNHNDLLKVVKTAESLGLKEGCDFFLIKDNCLTELTPEETDENGVRRTLTCIGFKPLPDEICRALSKKYQLYQ